MSADTCRQLAYTEPRQAAVDAARLARGDAKPAPRHIPIFGPRSEQGNAALAAGGGK